jgi:RHS repeat-associated protein
MMSTALRTYIRGFDLVAMRDQAAGQNRYHHFDHQGTTQALTDSTGTVTDRFASDAWGVQVKRTGASINRQWYVANLGYTRQVEQALDYVRARYAAPAIGRWISRDPVPLGTPYVYAGDAPAAYVDPSGLRKWCGLPAGPCAGHDGWQKGAFRYCPAGSMFDPDTEWNTLAKTPSRLASCFGWAEGALGYYCFNPPGGRPISCGTLWHWFGRSGSDYYVELLDRIIAKSPSVRDQYEKLIRSAVSYAEQVLFPRGSCPGKEQQIYYEGQTGSSISQSEDRDLGLVPGGFRMWADAKVACLCDKGDDVFSMIFTLRLTDQQLGRDGADSHPTVSVQGDEPARCGRRDGGV